MNQSPFDKEIMEQLGQLIEKGFLVIPIDAELKAEYYNTCTRHNRNPHEQMRNDMVKRIKVLNKREQEAKEEEEKKKAEKQAHSHSFLEKTAIKLRGTDSNRKKD
jgi:hypothetical protein